MISVRGGPTHNPIPRLPDLHHFVKVWLQEANMEFGVPMIFEPLETER